MDWYELTLKAYKKYGAAAAAALFAFTALNLLPKNTPVAAINSVPALDTKPAS